jgi:ubiquitin-protein ligase
LRIQRPKKRSSLLCHTSSVSRTSSDIYLEVASRDERSAAMETGLPHATVSRVLKEIKDLQQNPLDGIKVRPGRACPHLQRCCPYFCPPPHPAHRPSCFPPPLLQVFVNEDNISEIHAEYEGPSGTPYEDCLFRMKLVLGAEFPNAPPKGELQPAGLALPCNTCLLLRSLFILLSFAEAEASEE